MFKIPDGCLPALAASVDGTLLFLWDMHFTGEACGEPEVPKAAPCRRLSVRASGGKISFSGTFVTATSAFQLFLGAFLWLVNNAPSILHNRMLYADAHKLSFRFWDLVDAYKLWINVDNFCMENRVITFRTQLFHFQENGRFTLYRNGVVLPIKDILGIHEKLYFCAIKEKTKIYLRGLVNIVRIVLMKNVKSGHAYVFICKNVYVDVGLNSSLSTMFETE